MVSSKLQVPISNRSHAMYQELAGRLKQENWKTEIAGHQKLKPLSSCILKGTGRAPYAWNYCHPKRDATSHHQNHYLGASANAAWQQETCTSSPGWQVISSDCTQFPVCIMSSFICGKMIWKDIWKIVSTPGVVHGFCTSKTDLTRAVFSCGIKVWLITFGS